MSANKTPSILIVGGSGQAGSRTARLLRQRQPELRIGIGGRDLKRAQAIASELGNADALSIDLTKPRLGLPAAREFDSIAMFVKDDTLESLRYAQATGAAHLSISSGAFEMAPEVAQFVQRPNASAVVFGSYWLAGAATLCTLQFAREFRSLERIEIGAVLDEHDVGGPAAAADYERLTSTSPSTLLLEDGQWRWVRGDTAQRRFTDSEGLELLGQAYTPYDVPGLAAATQARSVRFDIVVGDTAGRRRGAGFSTEMIIELWGKGPTGQDQHVRHELVHPEGQVPLTALCVTLQLERLLGLSGPGRVAPGLYFPEQLLEPGYALEQMQRAGLQYRRSS